jgi:hypothetical protein
VTSDPQSTSAPPDAPMLPPRRTILAPLPDETPPPPPDPAAGDARAAPQPPVPQRSTPGRGRSAAAPRTAGSSGPRATPRDEKPDSSTKAYLWRRNVRFIDRLLIDMEDHGARGGDINRSVVLRAAITALEQSGLARDLARCTDEQELADLITIRLTGKG